MCCFPLEPCLNRFNENPGRYWLSPIIKRDTEKGSKDSYLGGGRGTHSAFAI